jgi:hypothetical protein
LNSVITSAEKYYFYNSGYKVYKAVITSRKARNEKGDIRKECESDIGRV